MNFFNFVKTNKIEKCAKRQKLTPLIFFEQWRAARDAEFFNNLFFFF